MQAYPLRSNEIQSENPSEDAGLAADVGALVVAVAEGPAAAALLVAPRRSILRENLSKRGERMSNQNLLNTQ